MANFDTKQKRFSGMGLGTADPPLLPSPDATLDAGDRLHFLDLYSFVAGAVTTDGVFSSDGTAIVAGVGAAIQVSEYNASGIATVNGISGVIQGSVYSADGMATVLGVGEDGSSPATVVEAEFSSAGSATVNGVSGVIQGSVYSSEGFATVNGVSGVTQGSVYNSAGSAFVFGVGEDATNPIPPGTPGNLFVPIRYILTGETANVVPVQTVLVGGIDVVPVREFVGPANVVPVREVTTEVPRVKVVKV